MLTPALSAVITLLTLSPQLVNGWKELVVSLNSLHRAGLIGTTDDQIAAMNAAGGKLDTDIAALHAAAGPKPTGVAN